MLVTFDDDFMLKLLLWPSLPLLWPPFDCLSFVDDIRLTTSSIGGFLLSLLLTFVLSVLIFFRGLSEADEGAFALSRTPEVVISRSLGSFITAAVDIDDDFVTEA